MFRDKTSGKYRLALSEQVLVAFVLGIAAGVFFGEMTSWLKIVGDIFIKLLQITVIPYISLSLIIGLGQLSIKEIKKLAVTGGSILLLTWAVVITLVVFAPLSFPNWPTASFFSTSLVEEGTSPDFLKLFIPSNPFYAYSNAIVPAFVVFSILIGVALVGVKNNTSLLKPLIAASDALIKVTSMVSKLAPIGVFALIAYTIGTISIEDLTRLQVFIVVYVLLALILGLWLLPAAITCLTPFRYTDVLLHCARH